MVEANPMLIPLTRTKIKKKQYTNFRNNQLYKQQ